MSADRDLLGSVLAALPGPDEHMAWIEEVVSFGVRRPGSRENARTVEWCAARLEALGYDVALQPVPALTSHPGPARVEAWSVDDPSRHLTLHGMTMPFSTEAPASTPPVERRFRLAGRAEDTSASSNGAVLEHVPLTRLPVSLIDGAARGRHDPTGEFADHVHVLPFGTALGKEIDAVVASGAGAMIGVLDAPWDSSDYFVPYDGAVRPVPALWLDAGQGAALDELLTDGPVDVELTPEVEHRQSVDLNVIATAPAPGNDEWIVVGSHHDAPWASAVEDGSGIAQLLAQATAWSAVPPEQRPASLAFLLTAAHMSEGAGTQEFIRSWEHRDHIRFALHLEHIAVEAEPDGAGGLQPTDRPEVRWWFVSAPDPAHEAEVVDGVSRAIVADDLDRSLVLPPDLFGEFPPTDGGFFHLAGVPMVNLLAAPMYLFDPADTVEMIHRPSLVPVSRAAARLVAEAAGWGQG